MNMNKILQNMNSAENGEYNAGKFDSDGMKNILESFYAVAESDASTSSTTKTLKENNDVEVVLDLLKQFVKLKKDPEDKRRVKTIYQAFKQDMDKGFDTLKSFWEINLDAEIYHFAKEKGVDLNSMDTNESTVSDNESKKVNESVSITGDTADEVAQLARLMGDAGAPEAGPVGAQPVDMPEPQPAQPDSEMGAEEPQSGDMMTPRMMDDLEIEDADIVEDDYANEPDEKYNDHHTMTKDNAGGLNREKGSYKDAEDGDNPIAAKEGKLKEELSKLLKQKMNEKEEKPDFLDLDDDGDTDEPMKDAAKDKKSDKEKSSKNDKSGMTDKQKKYFSKNDESVEEAKKKKSDPCWKNYKQVGMKKKNGKKVPNCVPKEGVGESSKFTGIAEDDVEEMDYDSFHNDENLQQLRDAIENNKIVSVAFVKKDGAVRQMAIKKNLSSYKASELPKTDKQANVQQNNNIKKVVDVNSYKKKLAEYKSQGMEESEAKSEAAKKSWRSINLGNVLGFSVGGQFIDLRDENEIKDRFGEEVYNTLSKTMQKSQDQNSAEEGVQEAGKKGSNFDYDDIHKMQSMDLESAKEYFKEIIDSSRMKPAKKNYWNHRADEARSVNDVIFQFNALYMSGDGQAVIGTRNSMRKSSYRDKYEGAAPVFDRYIKPVIDKTPAQIVEFYDDQARSVIKHLSKERRSLAEKKRNVKQHDAVIGRLRENLHRISEKK